MAERKRHLLEMEGTWMERSAAEFARLWASGLEQAIKAKGVQSIHTAFSESSRSTAQKNDPLMILDYRFRWERDALLWIAAAPDVVSKIAEAIAGSQTGADVGKVGPRERWQELLDEAAVHVQAAHASADGKSREAPAGEFASSISEEVVAIFAIEVIIAGDKHPAVFIGMSKTLLELWTPAALVPANSSVTEAAQPARPALDLLLDVELPLSISFGRTYLPVRDILKLSTGSIVELNCPANEYVEVIVNNCTIARGEVVVIEGNYGVRIDEIISRRERLLLQHKKGLNPHRPMRVSA
jgi:flagellar motor switch protein FliN